MGTFGNFGELEFVVTWGLARFCGPCSVDGVRAEEVLRLGTWTPSAIPPREKILTWIWSTMSQTDCFRQCQTPNRDKTFSPLLQLNQTGWSGAEVAVAWAATLLGTEDITIVLTE